MPPISDPSSDVATVLSRGAVSSHDPDLLPRAERLYVTDPEGGLAWIFAIHDPEFVLEGTEVTLLNLRDGLIFPDEGNIFELRGDVESVIEGFDRDTGRFGPTRAVGPVTMNLNIASTRSEQVEGTNVLRLSVRGRGALTTPEGDLVRFSANVIEELAELRPGAPPTRTIHTRLTLEAAH